MSETGDKRNSRQADRTLRTLYTALIKAKKKYKEKHGELPQDDYHFHLRDGMTPEEELLEIFHALVRTGMSPDEAKEKAPDELERIHMIIEEHEEKDS